LENETVRHLDFHFNLILQKTERDNILSNPDCAIKVTLNIFSGPSSINVPGVIAALQAAHNRFGRLPWAELFEPSVKMCEEGVPLDFATADALVYPDFNNYTMVEDVKKDAVLR
jgi:gamma-glutamyltranspeptidase